MTEPIERITVTAPLGYVIELYAEGVAEPIRLEVGSENLAGATRLFDLLRTARHVRATGEFREGWMNLIAVTERHPELRGVVIAQRAWER